MPNCPEVSPKTVVREILVEEPIKAEEIAAEAVTAAKIGKEAVTEEKTKPASLPAVAAEKTVKVGTAGGDRVVVANYTSDGTASQKFKLKHALKTQAVTTTIQTNVASKPAEELKTALPKITAINENEIEITLAASGQPAAGVTQWVRMKG